MDIFRGSVPERAKKLKAKVVQKYGDGIARQKAIAQLGEMKVPEAVSSLMARFTITVEPLTRDEDEKEQTFHLVKGFGEVAIGPVQEFLRASDHASSWGLRLLAELLPESEVVGVCTEMLHRLGSQYTRNPEKKIVLVQFLTGKDDARIPPAVLPLLEDMSDDVKIAALKALGPLKFEAAREAILKILTSEETARRVQAAAIAALHESGFGVQGYRERVESLLPEPYFVDKTGILKRRG